MILLLDNYDSFVHNVARYVRCAGKSTRVIRSDQITADACRHLAPEAIILSPGPHGPEQAGCCLDVVRQLAGVIPILGVCLGHQTIGAAYGARVIVGPPMHGMASEIRHDGTGVFTDLPSPMSVGRYHSLHVEAATLPPALQITAWADDDSTDARNPLVMGVADHARCVHGVQFHPESMLTEHGQTIIHRFFDLVDRHHRRQQQLQGGRFSDRCPVVWSPPMDACGVDSLTTPPNIPTVSIATSHHR
ncbi:MAG: aminodeoxychorismate/anthranilate synthase component II [Planctomycetota bacterium]